MIGYEKFALQGIPLRRAMEAVQHMKESERSAMTEDMYSGFFVRSKLPRTTDRDRTHVKHGQCQCIQ